MTDGFRSQLASMRDGAAILAVASLRSVDLDVSRQSLAASMLAWEDQASTVTAAMSSQAQALSLAYLSSYVRVSGAQYVGAATPSAVTVAGLDQVAPALWWRLGQGVGRDVALKSATAVVQRVVSSTISTAAIDALADGIHAEPAVSAWQRVPAIGCCKFCAELAGVTRLDGQRMKPLHPSDRCTQEPILRDMPERVTRSAPTVVAP